MNHEIPKVTFAQIVKQPSVYVMVIAVALAVAAITTALSNKNESCEYCKEQMKEMRESYERELRGKDVIIAKQDGIIQAKTERENGLTDALLTERQIRLEAFLKVNQKTNQKTDSATNKDFANDLKNEAKKPRPR